MGHRYQQVDRMECSFAEYDTAPTDHFTYIDKNILLDLSTSNEGEWNLQNAV